MRQPETDIVKFLEGITIERLDAMSDVEISNLIRPYFPAVRTPVLPAGKFKKVGVNARVAQDMLTENAAEIDALLLAMGRIK